MSADFSIPYGYTAESLSFPSYTDSRDNSFTRYGAAEPAPPDTFLGLLKR
jgi:hypothetical protein